MKPKELNKLVLNQEFVRHLTSGELRNIAGGFAISYPLKTCPSGFTCPECNPPALKKE
jgi:hypothetical protein